MSTSSGVDARYGEDGTGGPAPRIGILKVDTSLPTRMLRLSKTSHRVLG
jgi:hypothetical protein